MMWLFSGAGTMLAGLFGLLRRLRPPRPIHPHGVALTGSLRWLHPRDGHPPEEGVDGRLSRSIGLPTFLPDVIGLALRISPQAGPVDLALASTGRSPMGRFVLAAHRSPSRAWLSSLLPYEGERGLVLLAARPVTPAVLPARPADIACALRDEPWRLMLHVASPRGRWHPIAELELRAVGDPVDSPLRIDTGAHPPPCARVPRWVSALRDPSYRRVQKRSSST